MEAILFSSDWRRSSLGDSLLPSLSIVFEGSGNCERYENNLLLLIVSNGKNKKQNLEIRKIPSGNFKSI